MNPYLDAVWRELAADVDRAILSEVKDKTGEELAPEDLGGRLNWTTEGDESIQVWFLDGNPLCRVTASIETPSKTLRRMQQACVKVERLWSGRGETIA